MADPPGIGDSAVDKSGIAAAASQQQVFHAWTNMTRQLGVLLPKRINTANTSRAALDALVKKWNAL